MKTPLLFIALLMTGSVSFAQTKLAEEFPTMMQARNADATAFVQARTTPDFVFIAGHDGSRQNKDWLLGLFKNQKSQKADITNLSIQQAGDLAVATGISTITASRLMAAKPVSIRMPLPIFCAGSTINGCLQTCITPKWSTSRMYVGR